MGFQQSITINAPVDSVFEQYKQVEHWHLWDESVQSASLHGGFKIGTSGTLKPVQGPRATFELSEITSNQSFTTKTKLPFCILTFEHILFETEHGVQATHRVYFTGALAFIFVKLIGSSIKKDLPQALLGLKRLCEKTVI